MRTPPGVKAVKPPPVLTSAEVDLVRSLVIFEDASILALAKPAGLTSQGGRGQGNTLDELLHAFAKPSGRRPVLVHRLDRDTSGVILAARTAYAASVLGNTAPGSNPAWIVACSACSRSVIRPSSSPSTKAPRPPNRISPGPIQSAPKLMNAPITRSGPTTSAITDSHSPFCSDST